MPATTLIITTATDLPPRPPGQPLFGRNASWELPIKLSQTASVSTLVSGLSGDTGAEGEG